MTKGILLTCYNKVGYGYAAFNFAASIKFHSPEVHITLLTDATAISHFGDNQKAIFDSIIVLGTPVSDPGLFKVSIYSQLPYDYTLFMDVDALCINPVGGLLDHLISDYENDPDGKFYRCHVHGWYDKDSPEDMPLMYWAHKSVIWETYNFTDHKLPATQSSIQFIAKCEKAQKFFEDLSHLMEHNYIPLEALKNKWGGTQPDELYLNIQIAKNRLTPDIKSVMWFCDNSAYRPHQLKGLNYIFLSYFGVKAQLKVFFIDFYDRELIQILRAIGFDNHIWKSQHIFHSKHAGNKTTRNDKNVERSKDLALQAQADREVFTPASSKKINVFTCYYKARSAQRQKELDTCIEKNLILADHVYLISECEVPFESNKLTVIRSNRPTFQDIVNVVNQYNGNDIAFMCNSDIHLTESTSMVKDLNLDNTALCLSRWEFQSNGTIHHYGYEYSQDSWIWEGKNKVTGADYHFGLLGCDNKFAQDLFNAGYKLSNPSRHLKTIHVHGSNERSYSEKTRLPRPYKNVPVNGISELIQKPKLLLNQPGKVGDILICLPIAEHYSKLGYDVEWLCPKEYHSLFNYVDYCKPVTSQSGAYKKEIDLSFGLNTKSKVHQLWLKERKNLESFIDLKYSIAEVPIENFRKLNYKRNIENENKLYDLLGLSEGDVFTLLHRNSDYGTHIDVDTNGNRIVEFSPMLNFCIFDWRKVIENASEIHCIDSSLLNFVDSIETNAKLFYHITDKVPHQYDRARLVKNWEVINNLKEKYEAQLA
jgi:hypothetical protein